MISKEDLDLKITCKTLAKQMWNTGKALDGKDVSVSTTVEKMDFVSEFSSNLAKYIIIDYSRLLFDKFKIQLKGVRHYTNQKVRNANFFEYEYEIDGKGSFFALSIGKSGHCCSSLYAFADSLYYSRTESGCSSCNFDIEGCEQCGLNKVRSIITADDSFRTFSKTSKILFDVLGDKINPLLEFIDSSIKYLKEINGLEVEYYIHGVEDEGTYEEME
jgi:hypothetical protein